MARTERQIWRRHGRSCGHFKKKDPRDYTNCECSIYARVTVVDPDTDQVLFRWADASLSKLGIRNMDDANALVDKWFKEYLTRARKPQVEEVQENKAEARLNKTVAAVADAFMERLEVVLKPKLKDYHRENVKNHTTHKKYKVLTDKLARYAQKHNLPLLKQFGTDEVFRFQESWKGRKLKDPKTGEFYLKDKTSVGKDREQGLMRKFFEWCRKNGYIVIDPCDALERIGALDSQPYPFTAEDRTQIYRMIPVTFPKSADYVSAFVGLLDKAAGRISAVATAEVAQLEEEGIWLRERKGEKDGKPNYVWFLLPPDVVALLRSVAPKSDNYFFWSGNSTLKTIVNHWEAEMLKLYRAAGIEGKRSHEWRDTMCENLQEAGADLEHMQAALGHRRKATTEKSYAGKNKRKYREADEFKRKMWGMAPGAGSAPQIALSGSAIFDWRTELRDLKSALDEGLISQEMFEAERQTVMANRKKNA